MENVHLIHWVLAFAGATLHVLKKVDEESHKEGYKFGNYLKKNKFRVIITAITIPVLMLIMDGNFEDILPINNVTSVLAGYQADSLFTVVIGRAGKKFGSEEQNS